MNSPKIESGNFPAKVHTPAKVRTPVWPGIEWLYNKVLAFMVAPNLADTGGDPLLATDMAAEALMGASNYATALGNGKLFVEISPWAELTVFRWPNPTYSDQLRYFTRTNGASLRPGPARHGKDAPCPDWARFGRPLEPVPGLGSSAGVATPDGRTLWAHDPVWTSSRAYAPEDSTVLVTELAAEGVQLKVEDFIHPELDLMARQYTIAGNAAEFLYHASFAPFAARPGEYGKPDPKRAGFAALYLPDEDVIMHFKPAGRPPEQNELQNIGDPTAARLDQAWARGGVFIAWGFDARSDGHRLSGSRGRAGADFYLGRVDAALSRKLVGGGGRVAVYIAIAGSAREAVAHVGRARAAGPALRAEAREHWRKISARVRMPADAGAAESRVARRSVLNLIQGQDRDGGCIVASVSRQPAYHFDWPRDGAFFDLALDLAGFPELVTRHHEFYRRAQFQHKIGFAPARIVNYQFPLYKPAGHWPSNIAADGAYGSIPSLIHFELDETALLAWDLWRHERALPGGEAQDYIARMKPVLERAADALLDYVDLKQAWTRPAFEDDAFPPKATLHCVASVLAGLAAAADAGPRWGIENARCEKWREAAFVLRQGAVQRIARPNFGELAGWRGPSWSLWPAPIFDDNSDPAAQAIKRSLADKIAAKISGNTPGFVYLGEEIFTLALADADRGEHRELLLDALRFFAAEVPIPGADCYGEVTLWVEAAGKRLAQQRTSIPHLWNGITVYLSAMALHQPEAFAGMKPPAPPARSE